MVIVLLEFLSVPFVPFVQSSSAPSTFPLSSIVSVQSQGAGRRNASLPSVEQSLLTIEGYIFTGLTLSDSPLLFVKGSLIPSSLTALKMEQCHFLSISTSTSSGSFALLQGSAELN